MPVKYVKKITREMVQSEPDAIFVFGDNLERVGLGGQAGAMRGEPNAIGVATKRAPGVDDADFFVDDDECRLILSSEIAPVLEMVNAGKTVYVPADGLGTGLSELPKRAPYLAKLLVDEFRKLPGEACPWDDVVVHSIKAFNADMSCRGHTFEVGKTYTVKGRISACNNGFHACTGSPLDVWDYYPLVDGDGKFTRYGTVDQFGGMDRDGNKLASASITLTAQLELPEFLKRAVSWTFDALKDVFALPDAASGDASQLAASGDASQLAASGDASKLAASGDASQLAASGYASKLAASGNASQLAASGYASQLAASGYASKLAASGYASQLAASGDASKLAASGNDSQLAASGYASKLAASGYASKLAASGNDSQLAASGYASKLAASGDDSQLAASGDASKLAASGDASKLAASGDASQLAASGDASKLAASGYANVIVSSGASSFAKGPAGTWVSLAEFNDEGKCIGFASGKIGDGGIEPDVWLMASGGRLVKAYD